MVGGTAPSQQPYSQYSGYHHPPVPPPGQPNQGPGAPEQQHQSSSESPLDYDTFWHMQQELGIPRLRDQINHAAALNQSQDGMSLGPFAGPLYSYNSVSGAYEQTGYRMNEGYGQQQPAPQAGYPVQPPPAAAGPVQQGIFYTAGVQDFLSPTTGSTHSGEYYHSSHPQPNYRTYNQPQAQANLTSNYNTAQVQNPNPLHEYKQPPVPPQPTQAQAHTTTSPTHVEPVYPQPPPPAHVADPSNVGQQDYTTQEMLPPINTDVAYHHPTPTPPLGTLVPPQPVEEFKEHVRETPRQKGKKPAKKRKRTRKEEEESDSDSDDEAKAEKIGKYPDGTPVRL